jgi:hypothetical protein
MVLFLDNIYEGFKSSLLQERSVYIEDRGERRKRRERGEKERERGGREEGERRKRGGRQMNLRIQSYSQHGPFQELIYIVVLIVHEIKVQRIGNQNGKHVVQSVPLSRSETTKSICLQSLNE